MDAPDRQPAIADRLQAARRSRAAARLAEALAAQAEAVALLREMEDAPRLAHARRHQAEMLVEAGRAGEAGPVIAEVLDFYAAHPPGEPLEAANALRVAALQAEASGDTAAARALWTQARDAYARLDDAFAPGPNAGVAECRARLDALPGTGR